MPKDKKLTSGDDSGRKHIIIQQKLEILEKQEKHVSIKDFMAEYHVGQ